MKKWILSLLAVLILLMIFTYIFIPAKINISNISYTGCISKNINYCLHNQDKWILWWPDVSENKMSSDSFFIYKDCYYKLTKLLSDGAEIQLIKNENTFQTKIFLISAGKDSTIAEWQMSFVTSLNPIKRLLQYFEAVNIRNNMKTVLESLYTFAEKTKNIYGIDVKSMKVKFENLITSKKSFSHYPNTKEIYEMINEVRNYISNQGGKEEDYPMLSIMTSDSIRYETQVGIPVDKKLAGNDIFSLKWMLKGGNILVTEITGDVKTTDQALKQFNKYVTDHQFTVIAIPFQSLVTDRMREKDSTKWVTRLYYPVI